MQEKLKREPKEKELLRIAKIVSWNLWQMDGLTYTIPYREPTEPNEQMSLFDFMKKDGNAFCIIKDWRARKNITFQDLISKEDYANERK